MTSLSDAVKAEKKGDEELKTSFFQLKFSPDYVNAVGYYEKSAKIYRDNKSYQKAVDVYLKAVQCNKKLLESWAEGCNFLSVSEIYFLNLNNEIKGFEYMREAQISFKLANKYHASLKAMTDLSSKLQEYSEEAIMPEYSIISLKILREAWNDSINNVDNSVIMASIDSLFSKLLDSYLNESNKCDTLNGVQICNDYLKILDAQKVKKSHKFTNLYARMVMMKLMERKFKEAEEFINFAGKYVDSTTRDDVADMKSLISNFKEKREDKIKYLMTYSYHLFERNLLKNLKISFDQYNIEINSAENFIDFIDDTSTKEESTIKNQSEQMEAEEFI